jgi:hypothetical protein
MVAKTWILAGAALLAAFAVVEPAAAQQSPQYQNSPQPGLPDGSALFKMFDKNGDGVIDKSEADAIASAAFTAVDANHDGQLSMAEVSNALRGVVNRSLDRLRPGQKGAQANSGRPPALNRPGNGGPNASNNPRGTGRYGVGAGRGQPGRTFNNPPRFQPRYGYGSRFPEYAPRFRAPNGYGPRFQPNPLPFRPGFGRPYGYGPRGQQPNGPGIGRPKVHHHRHRVQPPAGGGPAASAPPAPSVAPGGPAPQGGVGNASPTPAPGSAPAPRGRGRLPTFASIDRNGDGVITPDEFAAAIGGSAAR